MVTLFTQPGTIVLQRVESPAPAGNNLATAAQALVPGYGATSYAGFSPATLNVMIGGYLFDWQTRWHWDPVNLKGYMMCKAQESTGSPPYKLFVYDAATDIFTKVYDLRAALGGSNLTGHGYDSAAMDQATGRFYFLQLSNIYVVRWTGSEWVNATGNITGGTGSASVGPPGLSWHPNLWGTGSGGLLNTYSNRIRAWKASDGDTGLWTQTVKSDGTTFVTPYSSGSYSQGVYCSALNAQIVTFGDKGLAVAMVTPGSPPVANLMPYNLPILCSSQASGGDKLSRLVPTPSGSVAIFEANSGSRVWRLNVEPTSASYLQWEVQSYTHPLRLTNSDFPIMYVSTYGIYWALREVNNGSSTPNSLLWRPPSGL